MNNEKKKPYEYKRDAKGKLIKLLEVLYTENKPMPLPAIVDAFAFSYGIILSKSTFYKLVKEFNEEDTSFKIAHTNGSGTNKGYELKPSVERIEDRSVGTHYVLDRFSENVGIRIPVQIADDTIDATINIYLLRLSKAIKEKNTISFKYFDTDTLESNELSKVTPLYFVFKPNKAWMYYSKNQKFNKINLYFVYDLNIQKDSKRDFDHIDVDEFKEKYLDIHGYFKNEINEHIITITNEKVIFEFNKFLMEQNFIRFYSSGKKTKGSKEHEFRFTSLTKSQAKYFDRQIELLNNFYK